MALRIFQFGIVFAIGYCLGPASPLVGALGLPEFNSLQVSDPKDVIVRRGQSATLRCDAKSTKSLQIIWLHNDSLIQSNDTRRFVQADGSLFFPKVVGAKKNNRITGEYRCKATTQKVSILSNSATLKIASIGDFFHQQKNISVTEFQPAVLFCDIHSVPTAHIQWTYNSKPLPHDIRYVPLPSGALLITETHSSDAGAYRCIATNILLNRTKDSMIVQLAVSPNLGKTVAPVFLPLNILPNVTVLLGDNITLFCAVTGWPIPRVQWLNNNNIVINNSSVLQFHNITLKDAGTYVCMSYNSGGRITQEYTIDVQQKPYFNVTPTSKIYPPAKTVRLDCQAMGVPKPKIFWLKNGEPIPDEVRFRRHPTGLVISHTFTSDAGMYQCVATNSAGKVWAAAQLVSAFIDTPSPPDNVQCRPFDETSICLTWDSPKNTSITAYSIYCYYTVMGVEKDGPEFIINDTQHLATGLNFSTNYTFYIRLYSNIASDRSKKVTCETGLKGRRNLQIIPVNETSVELFWAKVSTDVPCNGTKPFYNIQWKRRGRAAISSNTTDAFTYVISGLLPSSEYDFRVIPFWNTEDNTPWVTYVPQIDGRFRNFTNSTDLIPLAPEKLHANRILATSVNLTWLDNNENTRYYTICLSSANADNIMNNCENGDLLKSVSNNFQINDLSANTSYKFKVRAHSFDDYDGPFSDSITVRTHADVPSKVLNLNYEIMNKTAICLYWDAPLRKNGKLTKYLVSYTPNSDWPLDDWFNKSVPITTHNITTACWSSLRNGQKTLSTVLVDLDPKYQYTVFVRAASEVGLGNPVFPIKINTNVIKNVEQHIPENSEDVEDDVEYNQKLGVTMGVSLSLVCVIFCISCILVRKKCLKSRSFNRSGLAASNYYPAVAHYASEGSSVQVRLENPCPAEMHEIEHLVNEHPITHIPTTAPTHLDTKGVERFPNGHINGSVKPYLNGHIQNGAVHITENPRYYLFNSNNGHIENKSKSSPYEEDSNSNLKTSKFHDLQHLFEYSKMKKSHLCNHLTNKKSKESINSGSSSETSLNATQLSCLDNSFMMHQKRMSPVLGPNG